MDNNDNQNNQTKQTDVQPVKRFEPKKLDKKTFIFLLVAMGLGLAIYVVVLLHRFFYTGLIHIPLFIALGYILNFVLYVSLLPFIIIHFIRSAKGIYLIVFMCLFSVFGQLFVLHDAMTLMLLFDPNAFVPNQNTIRAFFVFMLREALMVFFILSFVLYFRKKA